MARLCDISQAVHGSALRSPAGEILIKTGCDIAALGPDEYAAFLRAEAAKWAKVAKAGGIKAR